MALARISSKGQLTIPKEIREHLSLHTGDEVEFLIAPKGRVFIAPRTTDVEDICGLVSTKRKISIDEMNQAILTTAKKRHKK